MVQAWYMDDSKEDQRLEHHKNPPDFVPLDKLHKISGVEHFEINKEDPLNDNVLQQLKRERGYSYEDEITCSEQCLPNYHEKLKNFFTEHLHTDEEIRLVLEGSGYFDVRDSNDNWIRILVVPGDLIIIPAGIYHRFTLDDKVWNLAGAGAVLLSGSGARAGTIKKILALGPCLLPYSSPSDDVDVGTMREDNL